MTSARSVAVLVFVVLLTSVLAVDLRGAEIEDHPLISRYPGSTPTKIDGEEFQRFPLIVGVQADGLEFDSKTVEGRLTRNDQSHLPQWSAAELRSGGAPC